MRNTIGTIRQFQTKNFSVIVDALPEDDLDGSVAEGLDSGKFIAFVARARVFFHGEEIGADYLGGCIYESLDAFMDHRECGKVNRKWEAEGKSGRCGSYFAQMISEAIAEARKHLALAKSVYVRG